MAKTIVLYANVRLDVEVADDADVDDVIDEISSEVNYHFKYKTKDIEIINTDLFEISQ